MKTSRRNFLQNSCVAALTAALISPAATSFGQTRGTKALGGPLVANSNDPLARLTRQDFVPYIGGVMLATDSSGRTVGLQLIEVNDLRMDANENRGYTGESYSLIFERSGKSKTLGDLYQFDHFALGQFALSIISVGRSGKRFEAVVNRITPRAA